MSKSSKEQLRAQHKINTDYSKAEADVVRRRMLHERLAKACVVWVPVCHVIFIAFGFLFIALPSFNDSWNGVVSSVSMLSRLCGTFSSMGVVTISLYVIMLSGMAYVNSKIDRSGASDNGYPINLSSINSFEMVIDADLYPITREEENVFFVEVGMSFFMASIWWLLVCGLLSFAIR